METCVLLVSLWHLKLWISTAERWITGSRPGSQKATPAPFTSALSGAKHQRRGGLPTIKDLLQEDQKAFSASRVTIDLQPPPPPPSRPFP